jgi:hypothetical protein
MTERELPKPPSGLRAAGKRLWTTVAEPYVLTPGELAILEELCFTKDETVRLEKAVRELPDLVATGSMGQAKVHPLLNELRLRRTLLAKLTEQLNLPDMDQTIGLRAGQRHARTASLARWNRREDGAAAS